MNKMDRTLIANEIAAMLLQDSAILPDVRTKTFLDLNIAGNTILRWTRDEIVLSIERHLREVESRMAHDRRGNHVATKIWQWLMDASRVTYVPWVLNEKSPDFDPMKKHEQEVRDKLLDQLKANIDSAVREASALYG